MSLEKPWTKSSDIKSSERPVDPSEPSKSWEFMRGLGDVRDVVISQPKIEVMGLGDVRDVVISQPKLKSWVLLI